MTWLYDTFGTAWPLLAIVFFVVGLKALSNLFEKPAEISEADVAEIIDTFLKGGGRPYDWDDFISVTIKEPRLDAIRRRCAGLPEEFPSIDGKAYCSEEGKDVLRGYIAQLRATA